MSETFQSVLSIDPGGATGWSTWYLGTKTPLTRQRFGLVPGGSAGFRDWAIEEIHFGDYDVIVIEDWRLAGDTVNPDLEAKEILGALDMLCQVRGVPKPVRQHRSLKPQVTDDLLKKNGLWLLGPDVGWKDGRDVNDSAIHALVWAKHTDHLPTVARYWPEW